ncbi:hypothetical protein [Clostridium baratii]|uniref:hypothetical protein n=1 Tax=Clostridium baratii TaxID=1561 RepID=UPI002902593A|nr:hypothetical protein [Clostridium baratii]MDU1053437.1 hypothetical protein [Clostridium baratii]
MTDKEINDIAINLIFNYLNNASKYTKSYIQENFQGAITILSKNLKDYFSTNVSIQSMQQGQRNVTYKDITINSLIQEIKPLLPMARPRTGIVYV